MRKSIESQEMEEVISVDQSWLDLGSIAQVELTSEDKAHPIESALTLEGGSGWKAAQPGEQTIRLVFDTPQNISHIQIRFCAEQQRTQEFVLSWLQTGNQSYKEIVRQQYTFSSSSTEELENYSVELQSVTAIELTIIPDISSNDAYATFAELKLG